MKKHVVASTAEIPPGARKLVTVAGRPIVIFNLDGNFFGLFNRCPHNGGSLADGIVTGLVRSTEPGTYTYCRRGEVVRCPWHGWEFDIRTGQSFCRPGDLKARQFNIEVADGRDIVEGPYVAETVSVRTEDNYIVVEV